MATIYRIDNTYYADWYDNNGKKHQLTSSDPVWLESSVINNWGICNIQFSGSYYN